MEEYAKTASLSKRSTAILFKTEVGENLRACDCVSLYRVVKEREKYCCDIITENVSEEQPERSL